LKQLGPDLMEMESGSVAQVCWYLRTPFLCIRSGSNRTQNSPDNDYRTLSPFASRQAALFTVSLVKELRSKKIRMKLFTRGDVDGFCAIALDNIVQLLLVPALCLGSRAFRRRWFSGRFSGDRGLLSGGEFVLRVAGAPIGEERRPQRCVRAAVWPEHADVYRLCVFGDAAGKADRDCAGSRQTRIRWRGRRGWWRASGSGLIEFFGAFDCRAGAADDAAGGLVGGVVGRGLGVSL